MIKNSCKDPAKIIANIPARGGSKGVHRKALRLLGDRPLISYTIRDALAVHGITKVFVSTDDPEIRSVSIEHGAEVPFLRPPELAQDDSRLEDVRSHDMTWYKENEGFVPDIEIIMSPTHPFRRKNLVGGALKFGIDNDHVFNVGSIAPAKAQLENYWEQTGGKTKRYIFPESGYPISKQLYESAFSFNIVFNCRPGITNRRIPVVLNDIESIDIDEPRDLEIARIVIEEGLYPFEE